MYDNLKSFAVTVKPWSTWTTETVEAINWNHAVNQMVAVYGCDRVNKQEVD